MLARRLEIGHQRDVDVQAVFLPDLAADLADRLEKRLALNVADGAADFGDDHVRVRLFADRIDKALDLVGDVRDHLHGFAQIFTAAFLGEYVGINLARGEVGELVQILVDKALIMPQIEVCFGAVLGHIHLAVLVGTHRARVNVDVGVELLRGYLESARLQQPAERGGGNALAESRHNAARYENIFCHSVLLASQLKVEN